jgi:hypothetical protein
LQRVADLANGCLATLWCHPYQVQTNISK